MQPQAQQCHYSRGSNQQSKSRLQAETYQFSISTQFGELIPRSPSTIPLLVSLFIKWFRED